MNEFKTILTRLKEILSSKGQSIKKIRDKDVAAALNIKASTLASYKRRDKLPYQAILKYCYSNKIDIRKILHGEEEILSGKVRVRYFRSLEECGCFLNSF